MKTMIRKLTAVAIPAIAFNIISPALAEQDDAGVRAVLTEQVRDQDVTVPAPSPSNSAKIEQGSQNWLQARVTPSGSDGLRALVRRHAEANGIPFTIADAVVRVESRYNPRASNRGNFGLMQIRLQTARGVGYGGDASGLLNAETNARFGMKYLAQAYRMANGDTCRTIMKYQSGHMATSLSGANRAYCSKVRTIVARG